MFGKFAVAWLIVVAPAMAQDTPPPPSDTATENEAPVAYKTKKVCRSVEVVGSSIPRTTCKTKRIPIEPVDKDTEANAAKAAQSQGPDTGQ